MASVSECGGPFECGCASPAISSPSYLQLAHIGVCHAAAEGAVETAAPQAPPYNRLAGRWRGVLSTAPNLPLKVASRVRLGSLGGHCAQHQISRQHTLVDGTGAAVNPGRLTNGVMEAR